LACTALTGDEQPYSDTVNDAIRRLKDKLDSIANFNSGSKKDIFHIDYS